MTGNPILRTPNIDQLSRESASVSRFYVSPVCAPTRACLMTGRYNYRTRVVDTYIGRAMMETEEVTIAEMLSAAGYATGIFGKWHLGDNYPLRPMDQGFQTSLVHRGGGIGQPSDPPGGERKYTNPVLFRNGVAEQCEGYCTDVYYDNAMEFIAEAQADGKPFFAYLPDNCPHGPFHDVPADLKEYYASQDLSDAAFPQDVGHPLTGNPNLDVRAAIFAMVENVDRNIGRLLARLDEMQLTDNTIVIFMSDNGPEGRRYVSGFRGAKSSVYEGGIRSPLFVRWPGRLQAGIVADSHAAHIDIAPTLLDACGIALPEDVAFDGQSILPQLADGETAADDNTNRTIFIQTHRGDAPIRYHHFAAIGPRWKLVQHSGFGREQGFEGPPSFELFDLEADPYEERDAAADNPRIVARMRAQYDAWFDDVGSTREDNYAPPRIVVGSPHETDSVLTRQDWRHRSGGRWGRNSHGVWLIEIARAAKYRVRATFPAEPTAGTITLNLGTLNGGDVVLESDLAAGATEFTFDDVTLPDGAATVDFKIHHAIGGGQDRGQEINRGPHQVEISLNAG